MTSLLQDLLLGSPGDSSLSPSLPPAPLPDELAPTLSPLVPELQTRGGEGPRRGALIDKP